jgi:Ran GTPase-activating protein (RanGAP) involved in mRNA processing and transport
MQRSGLTGTNAAVLLNVVRCHPSLTELRLWGNKLGGCGRGGEALAALVHRNATLRILDVSGNELVDEDVQSLAVGLKANAALVSLRMDENYMRDVGAKELFSALCSHPALTELDLSHNGMRDASEKCLVDFVAATPALVQLDVFGNFFNEKQTAAVHAALLRNRHGEPAAPPLPRKHACDTDADEPAKRAKHA